MKPGYLVRTMRASIGIPLGTLGLIVKSFNPRGSWPGAEEEKIYELQLIGMDPGFSSVRRYLGRDLEVISGS